MDGREAARPPGHNSHIRVFNQDQEGEFINIYLKVCIFFKCVLWQAWMYLIELPGLTKLSGLRERPLSSARTSSGLTLRPDLERSQREEGERGKWSYSCISYLVWTSFVYSHVDLPHLK